MRRSILSFKPGHDGSVAYVNDGKLVFSIEAEKDSFPRYCEVTPSAIIEAFSIMEDAPDVVAVSGWVKGFHSAEPPLETGYFEIRPDVIKERGLRFLGKDVRLFSSTHERSHVMCAYSMSPFEQGEPCYLLIWEGTLGDFYEIDRNLNIKKLGRVMEEPGNKYAFLFSLADPSYADRFRFSSAGKLMALSASSDRKALTPEERRTVEYILDNAILLRTKKSELSWSPFHNIGVEHPDFKNLAGKFSDVLFDRFHQFAKGHLRKGYPLLIAGGCGLNCEWNTKWKETKLFADVFVPPVANDTGSAIGTAVDAQYFYTKNAKVSWDVYSGPEFVWDVAVGGPFKRVPFSHEAVARFLADGNVLAWVQGKCEIGPRALGNRSILAAPFEKEMQARLNIIKQREQYRPIAPVCLEEDVSEMFDWQGPSPYMLYFQNVKSERLKAITHVDNSARVQTVNCFQNEPLYDLLKAFKAVSGFGVLCNTSLNFSGRGFINRISDLVRYVQERELDGFVVENEFYTR